MAAGDRWLEAMNIQRYVLRQPPAALAASPPAAPPEPPPVSMAGEPAAPAFVEPLPIREPAPDPAPGPDWEPAPGWESAPFPELSGDAGDDLMLELAAARSPAEERAARIATLDWDALQAAVAAYTACPLHAGRTRTVFGTGSRQAEWLIIGEAPGIDEDRLGEPFVGRAGQLLNAMLVALGLTREQVYIANTIKCRPPSNRDPLTAESACCWPYLARQIALLQPRLILAIGCIAAQTLLQTEVPVGKLRGRVHRLQGSDIPLVVSYHPAYLLRSPREKRKSWDDLQLARRTLAAARAHPAGG